MLAQKLKYIYITESRGKPTGKEKLLVQTDMPLRHMQLILNILQTRLGWVCVGVCVSIKSTIMINKKESLNNF